MDTLQILQKYSDIFTLDTIFSRAIRELCWNLVKLLSYIVDAISGVTDKLFVMDSFYNNPDVIKYIDSFKPLIVVLFGVSFCIIGYQLMYSQDKRFKQIAINLVVAIAVIIVLPEAMNKMNDITNAGVNAVNGKPSNMANQIIKDNTTDLLLYDKANFNETAIKQMPSSNEIKPEDIRYINPTSLVEPDFFNSMGIQNKEVFQKRLALGENGTKSIEDLNQGWGTWWKDYYYRYNINFLNIIVALAVTGATLVFTCFKLGTLIFELGYNKLLAIIVAPADIMSGQKTKKIVQKIVSIFIVTFLIAVLLKFYVLFVAMCASKKGMVWLVLMVAGSFAVMDGPDLVEKLFGIDAGLSSGMDTMMGAYALGNAASKMGKTVGKVGQTVKRTAASGAMAAGTMAGGVAGVVSGLSGEGTNNDEKQDKDLYKDMEKKNGENTTNSTDGDDGIEYPEGNEKGTEDSNPTGEGNSMSKSEGNAIDTEPERNVGNHELEDDLYQDMGTSVAKPINNSTSSTREGSNNISKPESNGNVDPNLASIDDNLASHYETEGSIGDQQTKDNLYQDMGTSAANPINNSASSTSKPESNSNVNPNLASYGTEEMSSSAANAKIDDNLASHYGTEGSIGNQESEANLDSLYGAEESIGNQQPEENVYQDMGHSTTSPASEVSNNISKPESNVGMDDGNLASLEGSIDNQGYEENVYQDMGYRTTSPINNSTNSTSESISNTGTDNNKSTRYSIGKYAKGKVKEKIQNSGVYNQTRKFYNLGKNTGENIRDRNEKNNQDKK